MQDGRGCVVLPDIGDGGEAVSTSTSRLQQPDGDPSAS